MTSQIEQPTSGADEVAKRLKSQFDAAVSANDRLSWSFIQPTYIRTAGFAVRYCFEFEYEGEDHYAPIHLAVSEYVGRFRWTSTPMFNAKGACICFVPTEEISAIFRDAPLREVDTEAVASDGVALCERVRSKLLSSGRGSGHTRSAPLWLSNEYLPGMHKIYVLSAPEKGIYSEHKPTDRLLNFSPSGHEWSRLMLSLLGIPLESPEAASFQGLQDVIPRFPMLSRVAGPYDRAEYSNSEIPILKQECQAESAALEDDAARSAVEKIWLAADWAEHLHSGLLFVSAE